MNETETQEARPASVARLWELHAELTEHLLAALKRQPVRASLLAVVRDFLRDSNIQARPGTAGLMEGLEGLQAAVKYPFDATPQADK